MSHPKQFHTYGADQIIVEFAGLIIHGFDDDDAVSIEYEDDDFTTTVGVDGEVTRSKNINMPATATLHLKYTSTSNDALSALSLLDRNAPGGAGVGTFKVRDRFGTTRYFAPQAWIQSRPSESIGREAGSREWVLALANLQTFAGGTGV
jgi:hypothetical protein